MKATSVLAAGLLAVSTAAAVPAAAGAKPNPYTPQQICGAGFGIIDSQDLPKLRGRGLAAQTYLLYNPATGNNCVTTIKRAAVGRPSWVTASVEVRNGVSRSDAGAFRYYAGPRKVHAPGRCVRWGGSFRFGSHNSGGFLSGWEHCG